MGKLQDGPAAAAPERSEGLAPSGGIDSHGAQEVAQDLGTCGIEGGIGPAAQARDLAQDALDDAVLMGGTQAQIKQTLLEIIEGLDSQYPEQTS